MALNIISLRHLMTNLKITSQNFEQVSQRFKINCKVSMYTLTSSFTNALYSFNNVNNIYVLIYYLKIYIHYCEQANEFRKYVSTCTVSKCIIKFKDKYVGTHNYVNVTN